MGVDVDETGQNQPVPPVDHPVGPALEAGSEIGDAGVGERQIGVPQINMTLLSRIPRDQPRSALDERCAHSAALRRGVDCAKARQSADATTSYSRPAAATPLVKRR